MSVWRELNPAAERSHSTLPVVVVVHDTKRSASCVDVLDAQVAASRHE
jgi:hypothetical protein